MNIGQLARLAGVPIDTVRYYERNGLLPLRERRESGYRNYQTSDVELRFVRRAKVLEFTLTEVRELLQLWDLRAEGAAEFKAWVTARLAKVDHKLDDFARLRGVAVVGGCAMSGAAQDVIALRRLSAAKKFAAEEH